MSEQPQQIEFTVEAVPVAQPRHRIVMVNGKAMAFQAQKSHPIHLFKLAVRMAAQAVYTGLPLECPVALSIDIILPRPKFMHWKRKSMPRVPHAKRGDLDNYCKGIIDALNKLLWLDDGQVSKIEASKWIASGEERPHVKITVKIHGES